MSRSYVNELFAARATVGAEIIYIGLSIDSIGLVRKQSSAFCPHHIKRFTG
jgi:hypothetical protein